MSPRSPSTDATRTACSHKNRLKTWLADGTPRVIMLDKVFDFVGSAGSETAQGCRPPSNTCPTSGGQDAINGANWCTNAKYPPQEVTYDKAALTPLEVKSNKSIVGVGSAGVLRGIGLRLANGVRNVIIQNIHITQLNPKLIWGGDAITLAGTDMVWIDHCKVPSSNRSQVPPDGRGSGLSAANASQFSLIGRQMIVTGYEAAGRVSLTNNEFDGKTSWSATCNGQHYWSMLFYGSDDKITMAGNYLHNLSGRAPKVAGTGDVTLHAVNNFFSNMNGNSFDVGVGASAWVEGNVFENVLRPFASGSYTAGGMVYDKSGTGCRSFVGRSCVANSVSDCGSFPTIDNTQIFAKFSGASVFKAAPISGVKASVLANAGIGKLSSIRKRGRAGRSGF